MYFHLFIIYLGEPRECVCANADCRGIRLNASYYLLFMFEWGYGSDENALLWISVEWQRYIYSNFNQMPKFE